MERLEEFRVNPTAALREDITEHFLTITHAENCLNVHIQRIIRNFKRSINYDANMADLRALNDSTKNGNAHAHENKAANELDNVKENESHETHELEHANQSRADLTN